MVFTLLMISECLLAFFGVTFLILGFLYRDYFFGGAFFCGIVLVINSLVFFDPWIKHSDDLATISSQRHVIDVYQGRVNTLAERLENFKYPDSGPLNSDTPVASIVSSLSRAEENLAIAKVVRAKAIRSIEARRIGPMSHVIKWVGDYK